MTICTTLTDSRGNFDVTVYQPVFAGTVQQPVYSAEIAGCDETWDIAITNGEDQKRRRLNFRDPRNSVYWLFLQEEF